MASFSNAVHRSFFAKIAIWLLEGSRDMTLYPTLPLTTDGKYAYVYENKTYSVMPKLEGQDPDVPGVNILMLGDVDITAGRLRKKRFITPVAIDVVRELTAGESPVASAARLKEVAETVDEVLRDGCLEIYDYSTATPTYTNYNAYWVGEELTWRNESLPEEGGFIRFILEFGVQWTEKTI